MNKNFNDENIIHSEVKI